MKLRKAFTLIELLVVIAIIAILAAILFPVFAQAKLMAKAAASTSNQKQLAMSEIMYSGDNDDFACPEAGWGSWSFPLNFGGTAPTGYLACWSYMVLPYTKNLGITNDPTGPIFSAPFSGWPYNTFESVNPGYGYDYCVMSPYEEMPGDAASYQHTTPSSSFSQASNTVMFTSRGYFLTEETGGISSYAASSLTVYGFVFPGGPILNGVVDPPNCGTIPAACMNNWGTGSQWGIGGGGMGMTTVTAGANTGGMSARAPQNQEGTISYCDGHAKKQSWAQASVGTNWTPTLSTNSLVVTNANTYMWYINYNFGY
jgi:prepilin-type N-terminal cleavage/methylation domain-containing protein